jgi:hypothetical protein
MMEYGSQISFSFLFFLSCVHGCTVCFFQRLSTSGDHGPTNLGLQSCGEWVANVKGKILVSCVSSRSAACDGELKRALSQDSTGIGFCFMFGP